MILYNVTVNIDANIEEEWLAYMKNEHIPEVLKTGCFSDNKIFRLLNDQEGEGVNYAMMYYADSMEKIELYMNKYAEGLQRASLERFKDRFVAYRSLLESVD